MILSQITHSLYTSLIQRFLYNGFASNQKVILTKCESTSINT